jgi:voltage-gated potassium channel Kch
MEDEIRDKVGDLKTTRIVCRTGNPIDLADLEIINPHASKAIIIPAPEMDDPDTNVIKSILAITNNPNRRPVEQPYHIVAEIRDRRNFEVARMVGKDEVELVLADDLISRITVQASLQSGLSVVYTDLLDFGGDEIYFAHKPELVGKTFGEALHMFEDSALIGLRYAPGKLALNPAMDQRIEADHQLIVIAEDDDRIRVSGSGDFGINAEVIRDPDFKTMIPVSVLILGWNRRAPSVLQELDNYLFKGSRIMVVAESGEAGEIISRQNAELRQARVEFMAGDITDRATLDAITPAAFQHVIILSYSDEMDPQQADARTLVTLLHLRDIADKQRAGYSIATEMLDIQNRDLAAVTRSDDFIVSNKLVSLMLTQVSENKELALVFQDLFDPDGSEMYLKPIGDYVAPGSEVNFHTIVEAARRKGQVAVGYRLARTAGSAGQAYGVHLNPPKGEQVKFEDGDRVIVLSES